MKKKYFDKALIFPALVVLVIIFILFQFTLPQIGKITEVRRALKQEKDQLERLEKKAADLEGRNEQNLKTDFQVAQEALPSEKDISGLLVTLKRLEAEATVRAEKLELRPGLISTPSGSKAATSSGQKEEPAPVAKSDSNLPSPVSFEYGVRGEFSAIRALLDKIMEINPILEIGSVKFLADKREALRADLKVIFYYQPLPVSLGKIEDSLPVLTAKDEETLTEISRRQIYSKMPFTIPFTGGKENPFE